MSRKLRRQFKKEAMARYYKKNRERLLEKIKQLKRSGKIIRLKSNEVYN